MSSPRKDGDAAVGSISHVLRTLFSPLYEELTEVPTGEASTSPSLSKDEPWYGTKQDLADDSELSARAGLKIAEIGSNLSVQQAQADKLLDYLSEQRSSAFRADEEERRELKEKGLLVNAHVPIPASHLKLGQDEMSAQGGHFSNSLLTAAALIQENKRAFAVRRGLNDNGEPAYASLKMNSLGDPGYMKTTSTNSIRRKLARVVKPNFVATSEIDKRPTRVPPVEERATFEQLELDQKVLERMDRKLKYLQNPRYDATNPNNMRRLVIPPASYIQTLNLPPPCAASPGPRDKKTAKPSDASTLFPSLAMISSSPEDSEGAPYLIIEPTSIVFDNFTMDVGCYERMVSIRNSSAVSRRVRLLPPSTPFFKMTQLKWPGSSNNSGDLAPGMALRFLLRFDPKKRSTYEDVLIVMNESVQQSINLKAVCEPAVLTLPSEVDVGACFLGTYLRRSIDVENTGNPGRFHLKVAHECNSFVVVPDDFFLGRNMRAKVEFLFEPKALAGNHRASLSIESEESPTTTHSIVGHASRIAIAVTSVDGSPALPVEGPVSLPFSTVLLGSVAHRRIEIANTSKLPVDFEWRFETESQGFTVEPEKGTLMPDEAHTTVVSFTPKSTDIIESDAVMMIKSVPRLAVENTLPEACRDQESELVDIEMLRLRLSGIGDVLRLQTSPAELVLEKPLVLGAEYEMKDHKVTVKNPCSIPARWRFCNPERGVDATSARFDPSVLLTSKHLATHRGTSDSQPAEGDWSGVELTWKCSSESEFIGPNESIECTPTLIARECGIVDISIGCNVLLPLEDKQVVEYEVSRLSLRASVTPGKIRFLQPEADLGMIAANTEKEIVIPFVNESNFPMHWSFRSLSVPDDKTSALMEDERPNVDVDLDKSNDVGREMISFDPCEGVTGAGERGSVKMIARPCGEPRLVRATAAVQMRYRDPVAISTQYLNVHGEIQKVRAKITAPNVDLGVLYNGVPVEREVTLVSECDLCATFKWDSGSSGGAFIAELLDGYEGDLREKEVKTVRMRFTSHCSGIVDESLRCSIAGMSEPLTLNVKAISKAAVLAYELLEEGAEPPKPIADPTLTQLPSNVELPELSSPPKIDFSVDASVPLFERRTTNFVVRNLSAIHAPFEIKLTKHPAADYVPNSLDGALSRGEGGEKNALLGESFARVKETFSSASGRAYVSRKLAEEEDKKILQAGHGVAFRVEPCSGLLAPWGVQVVSVTAYNNLAGTFHDNLQCAVQGMPLVRMPVKMTVSGCPLSFKSECVGLDMRHDDKPQLNFGQIFLGNNSKTLTRCVRVRNSGPIDATLSWRIGPDDENELDERLVDVSLRFAKADGLPLRVTVRFHEETEYQPPFAIEPSILKVDAHSEALMSITLPADSVKPGSQLLTDKPSEFRAALIANADWHKDADVDVSEHENKTEHEIRRKASLASAMKKKSITLPGLSSIAGITAKLKVDGVTDARRILGALKLRLKASLIEPRLQVDKKPDLDGHHTILFKTKSPLAILAARARLRTKKCDRLHESLRQTVLLRNPSDIDLAMRLVVSEPFSIANVRTSTFVLKRPSASTDEFVLKPRQTMTVELQFTPKVDQIEQGFDKSVPSLSRCKVQFDGTLMAAFATGQSQVIRLHADVLRPLLIASPSTYRFEQVRVGRSADLIVFLSNPTEVEAGWQLKHVPRAAGRADDGDDVLSADILDDPTVFHWSESIGKQAGPTLPVASAVACLPKDFSRFDDALFPQLTTELSWKSPDASKSLHEPGNLRLYDSLKEQAALNPRLLYPVIVSFCPSSEAEYCSRFRFEVAHGESFDVVIQGAGTRKEGVLKARVRAGSCCQHLSS